MNKTENKTKVSFVDKNRAKVNLEIEIKVEDYKKTLSITGDIGGGCGQIVDSIVPANEAQEKIVKLWKEYHLNDMQAGTPKQTETLEKWIAAGNKYDYTKFVEYLKCIDPNGVPLSALEVREIEAALSVIEPQLLNLQENEEKFDESVKAYSSKRGSAGWFIYDFDSINFEHRKIEKNVMGKAGRIGAYLDSDFSSKAFFRLVKAHFEKRYSEIKEKADKQKLRTLWYDLHEGKPYQYGTAWLTKPLPENIEEQIDELISEIESAEEERAGEPLDKLDDADLIDLIKEKTSFDGRDAELCAALVHMFDLSENDLEDISIDGTRVTVQGTDYTAGNEEEMTEAVTEDIKQSLWAFNSNFLASQTDLPEEVFTALQPQCEDANDAIEKLIERSVGIESFVEAAVNADGRGHFLNRYDGTEESTEIEGTKYFACRN